MLHILHATLIILRKMLIAEMTAGQKLLSCLFNFT